MQNTMLHQTDNDKQVRKEMTMSLRLVWFLTMCMTVLIATVFPSHAEVYVGGGLGISLPNSFSNVSGLGIDSSLKGSDLDLATSPIYGAKVGYFFPRLNWLGIEGEFLYSNPHMKQQRTTSTGTFNTPLGPVTGTATQDVPGAHVRMMTAAANVIARYPGKRFQPYIGVGFTMNWARFSSPAPRLGRAQVASDTSPGFNVLAGSRFFLTKHVALFGEYKYMKSSFDFGNNVLFQADYSAHNLIAGVSLHF
jgi:opacity protein-like surface antigen